MTSSHCDLQLVDLLNRQQHPCLWIADDSTSATLIPQVLRNSNIEAITNRCDVAQQLQDAGFQTYLNDFEFSCVHQRFDRIIFPVCKERSLAHHCINQSFDLLQPGGELVLVGEKNQGIKTHCKNAGQVFDNTCDSKKHGNCYVGVVTKRSTSPNRQLDSQQYSQLRWVEMPKLRFLSKPGIFGWEKIDRGSEFLVEQCRRQLQKSHRQPTSMLDLGCGYGYLTMMTADLDLASRHATDNNAAAVKAAQANFSQLHLEVNCTLDDCGSNIDKRFDLILCNPPFHRGFSTSGALTTKFLKNCGRLLHGKGMALWVVNKFIDVERPARHYFESVEVAADNKHFKVVKLSSPIS